MGGLTLGQIQQMGGQPVTPQPTAPAQTSQGLSLAQIQQMGGTPTQQQPAQPNVSPADLSNAGKNISQAFQGGVQQTEEGYNQAKNAKNPLDLLEGGTKLAAGVVNTAFAPLAPATAPLGVIINDIADKISNNQAVQKFASSQAGQTTSRVVGDVNNLNTIVGAVAGNELEKNVAATRATAKANAINNPPPPPPPETPPSQFTPEELQTHLQGVAEDWEKPTTDPASKYNNARTVLAKDPEIPTNLAKNGINPFTHIDDKGNFETSDTADSIRSDNGQLAQDYLRPALTEADYTTPKLPVTDLSPTPDTTYGNTASQSESIKSGIDAELEALQRKYPNGMSLIDQLNEKINYAKNGGYSQFKSNADNIASVVNRSISNSLDDNISNHVPDSLNYDNFQKLLASRYKMADYLDALNGKKVPVSAKLNMIRMAAKFGGAAVMRHIVPGFGDLITSFAGYQMGKQLETLIENMTNPMRDQFLQNMAQSNPDAIIGLQKYMSDNEIQRATQLKLPAPDSNRPIITPSPTTYENPAKIINRQPPEEQLRLPAGTSKSQGVPIKLPEDITKYNKKYIGR